MNTLKWTNGQKKRMRKKYYKKKHVKEDDAEEEEIGKGIFHVNTFSVFRRW